MFEEHAAEDRRHPAAIAGVSATLRTAGAPAIIAASTATTAVTTPVKFATSIRANIVAYRRESSEANRLTRCAYRRKKSLLPPRLYEGSDNSVGAFGSIRRVLLRTPAKMISK